MWLKMMRRLDGDTSCHRLGFDTRYVLPGRDLISDFYCARWGAFKWDDALCVDKARQQLGYLLTAMVWLLLGISMVNAGLVLCIRIQFNRHVCSDSQVLEVLCAYVSHGKQKDVKACDRLHAVAKLLETNPFELLQKEHCLMSASSSSIRSWLLSVCAARVDVPDVWGRIKIRSFGSFPVGISISYGQYPLYNLFVHDFKDLSKLDLSHFGLWFIVADYLEKGVAPAAYMAHLASSSAVFVQRSFGFPCCHDVRRLCVSLDATLRLSPGLIWLHLPLIADRLMRSEVVDRYSTRLDIYDMMLTEMYKMYLVGNVDNVGLQVLVDFVIDQLVCDVVGATRSFADKWHGSELTRDQHMILTTTLAGWLGYLLKKLHVARYIKQSSHWRPRRVVEVARDREPLHGGDAYTASPTKGLGAVS